MAWTLAPALVALRDEVNARWPDRSKSHDGTIGDRAHQARRSEHNPDSRGVVRAIDITAAGIDAGVLVDAAIGDARVHYVIYRGVIYSRTRGWRGVPYKGSNGHYQHVHISLRNGTSESADRATIDAAANDTRPWLTSASTPAPTPPAAATPAPGWLRRGSTGEQVKQLQAGLRGVFPAYRHSVDPRGVLLVVDGQFGPHTERWVREFQARAGCAVDGIVGPHTRAALARHGVRI